MSPVRAFKDLDEFKKLTPNDGPILIDGTGNRTQRPKDKDVRKENRSGKKKILR